MISGPEQLSRMLSDEFDTDEEEAPVIDPNTIKSLPDRLLYAAEHNRVDIIREILDGAPDLIAVQDSDGYTALHRASYNNHLDAARELLSRGASVSLVTKDGWQPLHSACRWNSLQVARLLLHNGADVNAQTSMGLTPLHLAASDKNAGDLLRLLLLHPCIQPDLESHAKETAFVIARRSGPHAHLFDVVGKNLEP